MIIKLALYRDWRAAYLAKTGPELIDALIEWQSFGWHFMSEIEPERYRALIVTAREAGLSAYVNNVVESVKGNKGA